MIRIWNDFWFDCQINNDLSLLFSQNKKYKNLGYINSYYYDIRPDMTGSHSFLELILFPDCHYFDYIIKDKHMFDKFEKQNIINELLEQLKQNCIVAPLVDLYDWNEEGAAYHRWHNFAHYTSIVQMDNNTNVVLAMEENRQLEYKIIEETFDNLYNAIMKIHNTGKDKYSFVYKNGYDYLTYSTNEFLPDFNFQVSDLIKNAKTIISSINNLNLEILFDFEEKNYPISDISIAELQSKTIKKIETRLDANLYLFDILQNTNIIKKKTYIHILELISESKSIIEQMLLILLKSTYTLNTNFEVEHREHLIKLLNKHLKNEIMIWEEVITQCMEADNFVTKNIFS